MKVLISENLVGNFPVTRLAVLLKKTDSVNIFLW